MVGSIACDRTAIYISKYGGSMRDRESEVPTTDHTDRLNTKQVGSLSERPRPAGRDGEEEIRVLREHAYRIHGDPG